MAENTIKVSVIISTYNRKKSLKKTIKSILAQSLQNFEIIVVDDCSTDNTEHFVRTINDERIRYFKTHKNTGHDGLPKNLGVNKARGEYIAFLDDDDTYRPDALKVLYNYITHSGADVVYADYMIEGKPGWSIDFNSRLLTKMNYVSMVVAIFKKRCFIEIGGFNENLHIFKDWNLWLRFHKRGYTFLHVPIIIATAAGAGKDRVSIKYNKYVEDLGGGSYRSKEFHPIDCKIYADKTMLGRERDLRVAVFTLTMDRLEYTKRSIEQAKKTAGYPFSWFVVDQGSQDGTKEWLKEQKWIQKIIYNEKNVGIAKGWNQAVDTIIESGKYDIIIKLDNDAEMLTQNWLQAMIEIFKINRRVILSPCVEGLEDSPGGVLRQTSSGASPYMTINDKILGLVPNLGGICFAAPKELYDNFRFEEETFWMGNKDYMLSQYAKQTGYGLFYMEEYRIWHIDGTKGQKAKYPEYEQIKKKLITQKAKYE
jgi:glycosyltransferase involved in cell wall biosynthesis